MELPASVLPQLSAACQLIWGFSCDTEIGHIFEQWAQGFLFSPDCLTALVQDKGGPCSVIVPTQAYIIKHILFDK